MQYLERVFRTLNKKIGRILLLRDPESGSFHFFAVFWVTQKKLSKGKILSETRENAGGDGCVLISQTETCCCSYLFYGPKNSTLSSHLHGPLVAAKTKGGYCGAAALCVSSIARITLSCCQN